MNTSASHTPEYVLGHSDHELARLGDQARILDAFTERLLREAGIQLGMHVLDVGCAAGDLSFLVANLVGSSGRVVGVDHSPEALATASARSLRMGLTNVEFIHGDLQADALELPEQVFDAVVGRLVLYILRDPVKCLRNLLRFVHPGGLAVFQERSIGRTGVAWPSVPLWNTVGRWWWEANKRSGTDGQLGLKLHGVFVEAGLPAPQLLLDVCVDGGADSPYYEWIASSTRSGLPALERLGIATAEEVGIETLAERLREETVGRAALLWVTSLVGAWARLQA
jgi:SAM-dependent methyltransferase